jgi:hypothetical protein
MKQLFRMRGLALLFLLVATATAVAAPPQAPTNLTGTIYQDESRNAIVFEWERGSVDDEITHYNLYRAPGIDATMGFELVSDVGGLDTVGNDHVWHYHQATIGSFTYRVTAVNDDGESAPTNSVSFTLTPLASITFTSTAPQTARVGAELVYDADAVASNGEAVRYELDDRPDSVGVDNSISLDATTGVLRMTPRWPGWITVLIRAVLPSDSRAVAIQYMRIRVINCTSPETSIKGTIVDENGAPIENGYLLYNLLDDAGSELSGGSLAFTNGAYRLDTIDAGRYRLRVAHGDFVAEWYQDAYTYAESTPVNVTCGSTTTADFTVTRHEPFDRFTVSGTVTAASSGLQIPAMLRFIGFEKGLPESHRLSRVDRLSYYTTDSVDLRGRFSVSLPNTHSWIVSAEAVDMMGRPGFDTLVKEFYDGATNPDGATRINESIEINFALESKPLRANGFSGALVDDNREPVDGYVVAYPVASFGRDNDGATTVETEGGRWRISNVEPGEYIVFAVPYGHGLAPGYFRADERAALTWDQATVITVGDEMLTSAHDIMLRTEVPGGMAKLYGMVGTMPGEALRSGGRLQKLNPVSGALVVALDDASRILGSAITNRAGQFTIDELPEGTHRILIDKAGFISSSESMEIRNGVDNGTTVQLERSESTTSAPDETISTGRSMSAWPNPASDAVIVAFDAASRGAATLSIVDATGRAVRSSRIEVVEGANRRPVDLGGLASGVYLVRIDGIGHPATTPVTVVR